MSPEERDPKYLWDMLDSARAVQWLGDEGSDVLRSDLSDFLLESLLAGGDDVVGIRSSQIPVGIAGGNVVDEFEIQSEKRMHVAKTGDRGTYKRRAVVAVIQGNVMASFGVSICGVVVARHLECTLDGVRASERE